MTNSEHIILAEIVREYRDQVTVGLATDAELAAVTGNIDTPAPVRGRIDRWHAVAIRSRADGFVTIHLLGRQLGLFRSMTSDVVAITLDRRLARTRNSTYALEEQAAGKPSPTMVRHVVRALLHWVREMYRRHEIRFDEIGHG